MVRELEQKLQKYLGVNHLSLVSNATIGLMIALKLLKQLAGMGQNQYL